MRYDQTFGENRIIIGENAQENEDLINMSKQNDLWFHIKDYSGPHLVLKINDSLTDTKLIVTKRILNYCANLVKLHSKKYMMKNLEIMYTEIRNIKLTKDTVGEVLVKNNKCQYLKV